MACWSYFSLRITLRPVLTYKLVMALGVVSAGATGFSMLQETPDRAPDLSTTFHATKIRRESSNRHRSSCCCGPFVTASYIRGMKYMGVGYEGDVAGGEKSQQICCPLVCKSWHGFVVMGRTQSKAVESLCT